VVRGIRLAGVSIVPYPVCRYGDRYVTRHDFGGDMALVLRLEWR
jgi:hypothetical protein